MNNEQNDTEAELAAWEILAETRQKLAKATEQLTKANETIGTMIDEIGMLQLKDKATTEQRDRLAVDLRKIKNAGGTYSDPYDELDFIDGVTYEALQSLKQNAEVCQPEGAKKL